MLANEKQRIVAETFEPRALVSEVTPARRESVGNGKQSLWKLANS